MNKLQNKKPNNSKAIKRKTQYKEYSERRQTQPSEDTTKLHIFCKENGLEPTFKHKFFGLVTTGKDPDDAMQYLLIEKHQKFEKDRQVAATLDSIKIDDYCMIHYLVGLKKSCFMKFLKQGLQRDECRKMALEEFDRKEKESRFEQQQKCNAWRQGNLRHLDYYVNDTFVRVAIIPKHFPRDMLETAELNTLENAIIEEVARGWEVEFQFQGINFGAGMLLIDCKNLATVEWLHHVAPQLHYWRGAELVACIEDQLPKQNTISVFVEKSREQDMNTIMAMIKYENDDLNVEDWKLLRSKKAPKGMLCLDIAVDVYSFSKIRRNGYVIRYGDGTASVQMRKFLNY